MGVASRCFRRLATGLTIRCSSYPYLICSDNNKLAQVVLVSTKDKFKFGYFVFTGCQPSEAKIDNTRVGKPLVKDKLAKIPIVNNLDSTLCKCNIKNFFVR